MHYVCINKDECFQRRWWAEGWQPRSCPQRAACFDLCSFGIILPAPAREHVQKRLTAGENYTANQQLPPKIWINQSLSWFPAHFMTHAEEYSYHRSDWTSYQKRQFSLSAALISTDYCYKRIVWKGWTTSKIKRNLVDFGVFRVVFTRTDRT